MFTYTLAYTVDLLFGGIKMDAQCLAKGYWTHTQIAQDSDRLIVVSKDTLTGTDVTLSVRTQQNGEVCWDNLDPVLSPIGLGEYFTSDDLKHIKDWLLARLDDAKQTA